MENLEEWAWFTRFGYFIRENRAAAFLAGAAALFSYGGWLIHDDITVDTEIMMTAPDSMMASWLGINRFGLVFTKLLFGMTSFSPFISRALTVVFLWLTAMFLSFCVCEWGGGQRRFRIFAAAFPALYLTGPCFAEQFYFVLQSAEVAFALFLCGIAVYGAGRFAFSVGRKRRRWAAFSVLLMVWAFGTYQAMAAVAVALSVIQYMIVYLGNRSFERKPACARQADAPPAHKSGAGVPLSRESLEGVLSSRESLEGASSFHESLAAAGGASELMPPDGENVQSKGKRGGQPGWILWFSFGIRLALIFAAGFILYMAAAALVRSLSGGSEAYVADMVHWKTDGVHQCVQCIIGEVRRVFDCYYVTFRPEFQWLLLLSGAAALVWAVKKKRGGIALFLAALALLAASPFFMTVVSGYYQPIRAQLVYPLVYAFLAAFLAAAVYPESGEENEQERAVGESREKRTGKYAENRFCPGMVRRLRRYVSLAVFGVCLVLSWRQGYDTSRLFGTVHKVSEQDIALTRDIYREAGREAAAGGMELSDCVFIFIGSRRAQLSGEDLRGDVIGCSFYQWDAASSMGSSRRIYDLMQAIGLPAKEPVLSRYLDSLPLADKMPCYPAGGSIRLDGDTVIVKLSEPET